MGCLGRMKRQFALFRANMFSLLGLFDEIQVFILCTFGYYIKVVPSWLFFKSYS